MRRCRSATSTTTRSRAASTSSTATSIDYENINRATMEHAVPSFFGGGNMTFFEHISLMIRASGRATPAAGRLLVEPRALPVPDQLHHRRAQPDVRAEGPAALVRHAAPRPRAANYTHARDHDYAHLDLWLGTERRARRVADRPCRAGEAQLDERHRWTSQTAHAGLRTSSATRSPRRSRTGARAAWRRATSLEHGAQPYQSAQRAVAADAAGGGDPDRLHERHRRGHARRADAEDGRLAASSGRCSSRSRAARARAPTTRRRRRSS